MHAPRQLIVNADDFGLSHGVNRGIIRAHEQGIVTSSSLMVRWPAAVEAAVYARSRPQLSVGLHVDLAEWRFADEHWRLAYEVADLTDSVAVAAEVARQLDRFRDLMGRDPSHLDSHQHVHREEPVRSILQREANALRVVLRGMDREVRYCGSFYGQSDKRYPCPEAISVEALVELLRGLPPGVTELGCHPGDDAGLDSVYRTERLLECETLCHPEVRSELAREEIRLCSFIEVHGQPA
jgi:predicted glycoside hydrolase/deacetylase ChbG (UPF0249 family)